MTTDEIMRRHAASRRTVLVRMPDGTMQPAALIAWKMTGNTQRARVQFRTGTQASVHVNEVSAPTGNMSRRGGTWYSVFDNGHAIAISQTEADAIEQAMADRETSRG